MSHFDVVFADSCLGGSTVAAKVAESGSGFRAVSIAGKRVCLTGSAVRLDDVRAQAPSLFPGWDIESIEAYAGREAVQANDQR